MASLLLYVSCTSAALMAGAGMYCFCRWAFASRHLLLRPLCSMRRGTIVVLLALAIGATIFAQKSGGDRSGEENVELRIENGELEGGTEPPRSGATEVTNLCFTGISVSSNGMAQLSLAWPMNHLFAGDIVDLFATTSLVDSAWNWVVAHSVTSSTETNWTEIVDTAAIAGTFNPPMMFFSASVRADPGDLRDTDGDTLPDAYEFHNGTNPYVPDYAAAPKLTVGPSGMYTNITSALAASESYDIIELDPSAVHNVDGLGASVPTYPVMVCSPPGTCAVVRATGRAAFLLDRASSSRTLFKDLYILLDAPSGYQAGFWVGGNLPWSGAGAAATFEDVYVRMPHPGVLCYGWHFYRGASEDAILSRCVVNAAGSDCAYGVYSYGSQSLVLDRCSFVNFPPNGAKTSCGVFLQTSSSAGGGAEVSVSRCLFDESFTNAVMFGRFEDGESNVLSVADCLVPRELPSLYHPDSVSGLVVTNAALSWAGFPWPNSPSVALGMGALAPIEDDPTIDTDNDGLYDYAEVYGYGTDPYFVDSDFDGIPDGTEVGQGTDPADPHSFMQNLTVTVTNTVTLSHAAYLAWGYSDTGWEANELVEFPFGAGTNTYTNASASGAAFVKAFCDLDDDGEYSPNADILLIKPIPQGAMATNSFVFGDVDGDGVTDEQERADGTDPYDGKNFWVTNAVLAYTDMDFGHGFTNMIAVSSSQYGWDVGEVVASFASATFTNMVSAVATGGVVYVKCLHDRDGDGLLDPQTERMTVTCLMATDNGKTVEVVVGDWDGDGVADTQELLDDTDPYDAKSFRLRVRIEVVNHDHTSSATNMLAITSGFSHWDPDCIVTSFTGLVASYDLDTKVSNRYAYVKCFRDFAGDGSAENGTNIMYQTLLGAAANNSRHRFVIGDYDSDSVMDGDELAGGTNPRENAAYCFSLNVTVSRIFVPSNGLSVIAYLGTESNILYGPCTQNDSTLTVDFGHLSTASREKVSFVFWEDMDGNGLRDEGERHAALVLPVAGYHMCVTNMMPLGDFDADGDGMPDDWELANGFSPSNAADAAGDADGDGFMNLHEYWAGTDPNDAMDDGAGTAIHAATHAVDDRIADKTGNVDDAKNIYENYNIKVFETNQIRNANCWISDIDMTCTSIWNDDPTYHYGDSATLITPQHVVLATHLGSPIGRGYIFRATNGTTTVRRLIDKTQIGLTDITVGLLESPLPAEYTPAKLLPPNYENYLGTGRLIPVLHLNKHRRAFVEELPNLPTWINRVEIWCNKGTTQLRYLFYEGLFGHDSGNPCFILIGDERILLYAVHANNKGQGGSLESIGPHTSLYVSEIKTAIDAMSDNAGEMRRELSFFDMSSYATLIQ